ncbi:polymer-forming cytoskeletal protein [Magnetospira sp. QH-2]|uniref:bactofilin family protein n=1 Tax=Magnetospira sp. (strain QH-2) TaxID=1288970 RepID=UPI000695FC45|nr:polymer-forming cytoskeletal protein [Magnetospira sp. QH-2]
MAASPSNASPSVISSDLHIVGDLTSEGEVQIDGSIDGDIKSHSILIGETAVIKGEMVADIIRVHGSITGQIRAREVILARTARMIGDILHENLSIEQGAFLEGHCRHMDTAKIETESRPALSAPPGAAEAKDAADKNENKAASAGSSRRGRGRGTNTTAEAKDKDDKEA